MTADQVAAAVDAHEHVIGWDRMCTGTDCGPAIHKALAEARAALGSGETSGR